MLFRLTFALYVLSIIVLATVLPSFTSCARRKRKREDSSGTDGHQIGQSQSEENDRMLSDAICNNRTEDVINLIAAKTRFSVKTKDKALVFSAQHGLFEILQALFEGRLFFSLSAKHQAFLQAALNNQAQVFKLLFNTFPETLTGYVSDRCLVEAAGKDEPEMFDFITSRQLEFSEKAINWALERAARKDESFNNAIVNLVAHVLKKDDDENGLKLASAVFHGESEIVASLLCEANQIGHISKSFALFLASCTNNPTILSMLLREKPKFHHDSRYRTVLVAVHRGYTEAVALLLENVFFTPEEKGQVLFEAVFLGHVEIVQMIVSAQGEIVAGNKIKRSILLSTIEHAQSPILEILVNSSLTFPMEVADEALSMVFKPSRVEMLALLVNSRLAFSTRAKHKVLVAAATLPTPNDSLKPIEVLLKSSICFADDTRYKSLFEAIRCGRTETVRRLLASGLIFNADKDKFLLRAVRNYHPKVVAALMTHVPDFSQKVKDRALVEAAQCGFRVIAIFLVGNVVSDGAKDKAFIQAARSGHMDTVTALLKTNVSAKAKNAILFAATESGRLQMVAFLLSDQSGLSFDEGVKGDALMEAARCGFTAIAIFIFENVVSDKVRHDALVVAARSGHTDIVRVLVKTNISPETKNTTLFAAAQCGRLEVVAALLSTASGLNFDEDIKGDVLILAARRGFTVMAILLFHSNASDKHKIRAPTEASNCGHHKTCVALKNEHSTLEAQNTALLVAVRHGCMEAVASLISSFDFELDVKKEALNEAKSSNQTEIVTLLSNILACEVAKAEALALIGKPVETDSEHKESNVPIDDHELFLRSIVENLESDD